MFSGVKTPPSLVKVNSMSFRAPSSARIFSALLNSPSFLLIMSCSKPDDLEKKRIFLGAACAMGRGEAKKRAAPRVMDRSIGTRVFMRLSIFVNRRQARWCLQTEKLQQH